MKTGELFSRIRWRIVILIGLLLLVCTIAIILLGRNRLPQPGNKAGVTATSTHEVALPTTPTVTHLPVPTLSPIQIIVSGDSQYDGDWPYLAEYTVSLARGTSVSVTLTCVGCLRSESQLSKGIALEPAQPGQLRVAVAPNKQVVFGLSVNETGCMTWKLTPGSGQSPLRGVCIPK